MTEEKALQLFREKYPQMIVVQIMDLKKYFVITATENLSAIQEEIDPYYFVDKKTGEIGSYSPTTDLNAFTNPRNKSRYLL